MKSSYYEGEVIILLKAKVELHKQYYTLSLYINETILTKRAAISSEKYNPKESRELHNQLNLFMGGKHAGWGVKLASDIMPRTIGMISLTNLSL
jgi:hypothetical protein